MRFFDVTFSRVLLLTVLGTGAMNGFAADAEDKRFSVSAGVDYTVGDYGQSGDTTIAYIPVTGKYYTGRWTFGVTVPYIEVEGPGNVTRDTGRYRNRSGSGTRTDSGIGDIVGAATANLFSSADTGGIDFTTKLKLGTADRDSGLGTGEEDVYVQIDAYRTVERLTPFVTLGYKFLGDPPSVELNDVLYASFGASYKLTSERSVGAMWFGQEKVSDGGAAQSEITVFLNQGLNRDWTAQVYGVLGLEDGSPDHGVGVVLTHRY